MKIVFSQDGAKVRYEHIKAGECFFYSSDTVWMKTVDGDAVSLLHGQLGSFEADEEYLLLDATLTAKPKIVD